MMRRTINSWLRMLSKVGFKDVQWRSSSQSSRRSPGRYSRRFRIEPLEERLALYAATTLIDNGPVAQRIDMVFVGDGFTETDLQTYIDSVSTVVFGDLEHTGFFELSPFDSYEPYFNVHRVDVLSAESGIDYAAQSILVDTALDGHVASGGFLAFSNSKAIAAAEDASESWDLIQGLLHNNTGFLVRANADLSGGISRYNHYDTARIHHHEVGHSLGKLGDEYDNEGSDTWTGGEPAYPNLTAYSSEQDMIDDQAKWYLWLDDPAHPEIGLREGGNRFYHHDIFRPSLTSIMRTPVVGATFDVVGREALILEIYKYEDISPIDDATPAGEYYYDHEFFVTPMAPSSHSLDIQWYVDTQPISGETGATFNPGDLSLPVGGEYTIKVEVIDNTDMVRDEAARTEFMTETREWTFRRIVQVTTGDDEDGTNPTEVSLREALDIVANGTIHPGADAIVIAPWVNEILLDSQLVIDSDVDISPLGESNVIIDAQGNSRVFQVNSGVTASITGLAVTGGGNVADGGGINNLGNLTLNFVDVVGNQSSNRGGGIYTTGQLRVTNSTIDDNQSKYGGGIYAPLDTGDHFYVENSTISNNTARDGMGSGTGGGITVTATSSGIPIWIVNTTISGNDSGWGGGLRGGTEAHVNVINSTITNNEASGYSTSNGGGITAINNSKFTMHNTIVAGNAATVSGTEDLFRNGSNNFDTSVSSYNLIRIGGSSGLSNGTLGNQVGSTGMPLNPNLSALGDYGGPTSTHALLNGSPAIDHGSDFMAMDASENSLSTEQRGYSRYFDEPSSTGTGGIVDIGAVEFSVPQVANVILSSYIASLVNEYGTNPPYEFDDFVGSEEQLLTVPVGSIDRISIQFTKDVTVSLQDLEFIALNRPINEPLIDSLILPDRANNYTATWTLTSPLPTGAQILIRLRDTVQDFEGYSLDGEWMNPGTVLTSLTTSTFPSGDNEAGGDFQFVFTNLPGDIDRNLKVDGADLGPFAANFPGVNKSFVQGDFDGDGLVNGQDLGLFSSHNGFDWRDLRIAGDYDGDFDLDGDDEDEFLTLYTASDIAADLNNSGAVTEADLDSFYELLGFDISLGPNIVT